MARWTLATNRESSLGRHARLCTCSGGFTGPTGAIRAVQIAGRFPSAYGAHPGLPRQIGIAGNAARTMATRSGAAGRVACLLGLRDDARAAIAAAKPAFCITHVPGTMLITDRRNASQACA